jgi:hypothetical protein
VAFGEAQHLAAQRGQAAVEGIEVVDQVFDLGRVELHAFDLRGQVLAQLLVLLFLGAGKSLPAPIASSRSAWIFSNFGTGR